MNNFSENFNFIWQITNDILHFKFKAHEYVDVILPFLVLRRLDCVLEPYKKNIIQIYEKFKDKENNLNKMLLDNVKPLQFYNISSYDLNRLKDDPDNIKINFNSYINGFSPNVCDIFKNFHIEKIIEKLMKNDLLFPLVSKFCEINLHPNQVSNHDIGYIFEELLRRFSEMSNETAGEHYTPREIIQLMVNLIFNENMNLNHDLIRIYDPACGTGGMLTTAKNYLKNINHNLKISLYGQELNEQTYAIAKSDILILGEDAKNIKQGNCFIQDGFKDMHFNYMLSNPPFGVSWKNEQAIILKESNDPQGRFYVGTPRVSDGALLFLQHMISKMEPSGCRLAIIFNGSPLFTGDAGSGESNIRKWIIENDFLEGIIALPMEMFFNTSIATYIWIMTNHKSKKRKGKIQLINGIKYCEKMKKSLGNKRNTISESHIQQITELYSQYKKSEDSLIIDNHELGYTKVTIERPEIKNGQIIKDRTGKIKSNKSLRDYEKIPLKKDIDVYFEREVKPHVPDAWMDRSKDKVGYEINFTKYFYKYKPLRSMEEIKQDILALEQESKSLLKNILDL